MMLVCKTELRLIRRRKMRHLPRIRLRKRRPCLRTRHIPMTSGIPRRPIKPIDKPKHIGHHDVGDGEGPRKPLAPYQHILHPIKPDLQELIQLLAPRRFVSIPGKLEERPRLACRCRLPVNLIQT